MVKNQDLNQYEQLAHAICNQALALAQDAVPAGQRYAAVKLLKNNVETLEAWTEDDRGEGKS